jgi:hypothetical protein
MDKDWASENLQVIRTLMERAALYRRALAPIMTVAGCIGLAGSIVPCFISVTSNRAFSLYWMLVSLVAVIASYLLVRRQALKEDEPFWSSPTQRVTRALLPVMFVGLMLGVTFAMQGPDTPAASWILGLAWVISYGCGIHAAGFFTVRGIKLFGWVFIIAGSALLLTATLNPAFRTAESAHYVMGSFFGVLHLAYGIYLYFTEKRRNPAL